MPPIRILVVDDSAVIRKVLCEGLAPDSALEVVGTAANGQIALAKIPQLNPDILTLDVEMPGMNGLETLAEVRKHYPKLPVIMFSTLTERGAATTLDALALGASDYVTKPSNTGSLDVTLAQIRDQLVPKIKALCPHRSLPPLSPPAMTKGIGPSASREQASVNLLAIGASTGGPNALAELVPSLPADLAVPVVIVQHMPPVFTRLLAARLNEKAKLTIREGAHGEKLKAGEAWIAPGDHHMTVERQGMDVKLALNQEVPENSCRPAVDPLFRSAAKVYGRNVLAVVLTGMGSDGTIGAQHVRERGGHVIVQDEGSSVVWGMPGSIVAAGLADGVYPLNELAHEIVRRVGKHRTEINVPVATRPALFGGK